MIKLEINKLQDKKENFTILVDEIHTIKLFGLLLYYKKIQYEVFNEDFLSPFNMCYKHNGTLYPIEKGLILKNLISMQKNNKDKINEKN